MEKQQFIENPYNRIINLANICLKSETNVNDKIKYIEQLGRTATSQGNNKIILLSCIFQLGEIAKSNTNVVVKLNCIKALGRALKIIESNDEETLLYCANSLEKILSSHQRTIGVFNILHDAVKDNNEFSKIIRANNERFTLLNNFLSIKYEEVLISKVNSKILIPTDNECIKPITEVRKSSEANTKSDTNTHFKLSANRTLDNIDNGNNNLINL